MCFSVKYGSWVRLLSPDVDINSRENDATLDDEVVGQLMPVLLLYPHSSTKNWTGNESPSCKSCTDENRI